jgi:hypothetical protein
MLSRSRRPRRLRVGKSFLYVCRHMAHRDRCRCSDCTSAFGVKRKWRGAPREFVTYRRDLATNAPNRVAVRVIARIARAMMFAPSGNAGTTSVEDTWTVRSNSYDFRVAPVGENSEMLVIRPENADFVLPAGTGAQGAGVRFHCGRPDHRPHPMPGAYRGGERGVLLGMPDPVSPHTSSFRAHVHGAVV